MGNIDSLRDWGHAGLCSNAMVNAAARTPGLRDCDGQHILCVSLFVGLLRSLELRWSSVGLEQVKLLPRLLLEVTMLRL